MPKESFAFFALSLTVSYITGSQVFVIFLSFDLCALLESPDCKRSSQVLFHFRGSELFVAQITSYGYVDRRVLRKLLVQMLVCLFYLSLHSSTKDSSVIFLELAAEPADKKIHVCIFQERLPLSMVSLDTLMIQMYSEAFL